MDQNLIDMQNASLNILQVFTDCCEKNNLRYYLAWGTLLGAVRHKGFIPWDDDIDVSMPRPDYEKFIEEFDTLMPGNMKLITPENTEHYDVFFAKVYDANTTYIQKGMKKYKERHTGVFIDIFPFDGFPDNELEREKYIRKYMLYRKLNYKMRFGISDVHTTKGKILHTLAIPIKLVLPNDYFYKKYRKLALSYDYDSSTDVAYPTLINLKDVVLSRKMFGDGQYAEFEGLMMKIPSDYDSILKTVYGDYMKLPPENEQFPHHDFDYMNINLPCCEYDEK